MLVLLDREYGNAKWVLATAELKVDCIMRMRSNACLWSVPKAYSGCGRPPIHGKKFQFTDAKTWGEPDSSLDLEDPVSGRVRVRMWTKLHFRKAAKNQVNLILVERLKPTGSGRIMPPLWLVWTGERTMLLEYTARISSVLIKRFGLFSLKIFDLLFYPDNPHNSLPLLHSCKISTFLKPEQLQKIFQGQM